jgi:hypothetical protein
VREFEPALDPVEATTDIVDGKLLRGIRTGEMAEMLNDRRLSAFEVRQSRSMLVELALHTIERRLEALEMLEHDILDIISHHGTLP